MVFLVPFFLIGNFMMKFGVVLPNFGQDASRLSILDTAHAAEGLGYDSVWVTDHLALPQADAERFGKIYETITTLSFLAGSTSRIRLGISALVLPQRNPVEVAKELATADVLSGGRVMLATGIGWSQGEYENLGYTFNDRGRRMDEALKVLRTLWRGNKVVSFKGKYYSFQDLVFEPQPVQAGGPPIWVAGDSPQALKRAIYYADGWHPNMRTPEELASAMKSARGLLGTRPFTVSLRMRAAFTPQPDPEIQLSGGPEDMITALRAFQAAGAQYSILYFPVETQAERERAMQTFSKQVMPALAD